LATIKSEMLNVGEMRIDFKCNNFKMTAGRERTAFQAQNISRDAQCRDFIALKSANVGSLNGKGYSLMHKRVAE
jgi:hypothetical protein